MEVRAVAKYIRISPFKVRILIDSIKGKSVEKGLIASSLCRKKLLRYW